MDEDKFKFCITVRAAELSSYVCKGDIFTNLGLCCAVNSLRDQLDDMKRKNQNSHISNEKNIHLQRQVSRFKSATAPDAFNDSQTEKKKKKVQGSQPDLPSVCFCRLPRVAVQLEEANALLRAESEAATRLRKTQTESSKQLQQLEANGRELQDKCCVLERSKLSLEKECISLQAALETERSEHSQGSETISDLMGGWRRAYRVED